MRWFDREDRKGYELTTRTGEFHVTDDQYTGRPTIRLSARTSQGYVTVSMPLARHIRMLCDIFKHEEVKRAMDNMPEPFRKGEKP